jgi:hypothetical protein
MILTLTPSLKHMSNPPNNTGPARLSKRQQKALAVQQERLAAMPTAEEVATFRAKVEAWLGGAKAFTALAGQRIKIGVEIGRQVNQWIPRIPYDKRGAWFAENLPGINRNTIQRLQRLAAKVDSGDFDLRQANNLHQAFVLSGALPANTQRGKSIKQARMRLITWARRVKVKILQENFDAYTPAQKVELKEALEPLVALYGRL